MAYDETGHTVYQMRQGLQYQPLMPILDPDMKHLALEYYR